MTGRDAFVISFTRSEIESRIKEFFCLHISDSELQDRYEISDYRAFKISKIRREMKFQPSRIVETSYRPFDHRWTYFQRPIIQEWQGSVHAHMFRRENRALCVGRAGNVVGGTWDICFCTKMVTDLNQFYRGGNVSLPIYRFPEEGGLLDKRVPNFTREFALSLGRALGLPLGNSALPEGLTPEDILHYAYAVFHSPGYRSRYAEFLKIDFPRLPLTRNLDLLHALARLGCELVALHLLESPKLERPTTTYIGSENPEVSRVGWSDDTVWLDAAATKKGQPATPGTIGFRGVPEAAWNYHIGGYQVCEKWLKDRKGRILSNDDIAHYQKIVVALAETIRLMQEIDEVIEQYGGWPGAFAQGDAETGETADSNNVVPLLHPKPPVFVHQSAPITLQKVAEPEAQRYAAAGTSARSATRPDLDELDREDLICRIRHMFDDGEQRERDAAVDALARELGYRDAGSRIHEAIENALRIAVGRKILANDGAALRLSARSIEQYERNLLKQQFLASLSGRPWIERDDAIRDFARWMGFRRTGRSIDETARSLINGLLREGRLERQGPLIRRPGGSV
jgi:hypothetical protein